MPDTLPASPLVDSGLDVMGAPIRRRTNPRALLERHVDQSRLVEFSLFLGSVLALQGSRFLFTLLVAAALLPSEFTRWALFVTFTGYAPSMLLGVGNGMNRLVPILIGRRDVAEAERAEGTTWAAVGVLLAACLSAIGLLLWAGAESWAIAGALAAAAVTVYQIQQFTMRSRLQFNRASAQQWCWACLMGLGILALLQSDRSLASVVSIWAVGALGAAAVGFGLRRPILRRPSRTLARRLLATGFPIMLSGLLGNLFYTADRWVASGRLEPSSAGAYGLASLLVSATFLVPTVIAQQQYPRLAMLYGRDVPGSQLLAAARRQSLIAALASATTALGVCAFAILILPAILPAYGGAALPAIILSLGITALAGGTGYSNLLIVTGALWSYLAIQLGCFAIALTMMWIGSGLSGAAGLAAGFCVGQAALTASAVILSRVLVQSRG